ncbi:hypothetical protein PR001_g24561 [Phytophthora rubi]|uniref:Uncharacterized protein n=1 Tax=Phytophthora rubi TaxID=129364 RepID=A0A6A3HV48_9STRA|nr:hypothetical protein PR002_g26238 [Phytophthora rubi]KAE8979407.1 hypothetical protein PR001_g24561 [Phytophthora rubi]
MVVCTCAAWRWLKLLEFWFPCFSIWPDGLDLNQTDQCSTHPATFFFYVCTL